MMWKPRATLSLLASVGFGLARGMVTTGVVSPTATRLVFEPPSKNVARKYLVCGTASALLSKGATDLLPLGLPIPRWKYLVSQAEEGAGNTGASSTWMFTGADGKPSTIIAAVLPAACSRHNSPVRPHAITSLIKGSSKSARIMVVLEDKSHAGGAALAVGRAFPLYSAKKRSAVRRKKASAAAAAADGIEAAPGDEDAEGSDDSGAPVMQVSFATRDGPLADGYGNLQVAADSVRRAAMLVDLPPNVLTTTAFVGEALAAAQRLNDDGKKVTSSVVSGEDLKDGGYGFLYAVGQCAEEPPALVVLSHVPEGAAKCVCVVGKGIVYDTGGLSLKTKDGMPGMKSDMGGAAAALAAFEAAVSIGTGGQALHLVLCLAENAIGSKAVRNDDVITCLSGLTCEINNSDAEGRLVLSDGVAHATSIPSRLPGLGESEQPDLLIDMATLTGAQLMATGKRHAAVVSNLEDVERAAVDAGRLSGDTVHPLPFVPEWYQAEFDSKVADMKNSVKDRSNAQASCAANFIYEHIHEDFEGGWLHVDLAGPAFLEERGTGFGVGLTLAMLGCDGFKS